MASELQVTYTGAQSPYAIIRRVSDGYVWNGTAFVVWADGNIAAYDVTLASQGGDSYAADWPSTIASGTYRATYYEYASGSTPAITDLHLPADHTVTWNGAAVVADPGPATMTVSEARGWVRQFARDANDSSHYDDADIDRAIMLIGDRFARVTRCIRAASSITIEDADATPSLTSAVALGFRPERLIDAFIVGETDPLSIVDYATLNAYASDIAATSGTPTGAIAFPTPSTCQVYPEPDDDYTLTLRWWNGFVSWTPGDSGADATVLNLPADYLREALVYGATATLQHTSPKHKYASESWKKYIDYEQRMAGAGTLGARVIIRERRRYA